MFATGKRCYKGKGKAVPGPGGSGYSLRGDQDGLSPMSRRYGDEGRKGKEKTKRGYGLGGEGVW